MNRTVGVLGGLGPLATVYFLKTVVDFTQAQSDQDNVDLIITQHSSTPDRTAALLDGGESPAPIMAADARKLQDAGAEFLVIPCNTATNFLQAVVEAVDIEVVNIVAETVAEIGRKNAGGIKRVAIMATAGTIASEIYQETLQLAGYEALVPSAQLQKEISGIIYGYVKAGQPVSRELFFGIINKLRQNGADAVICGCTELSVVYKDLQITDPTIVDSLATLARLTVIKAGKQLRPGL
ncbi:aspartate racemase [Mobiluncus mulieris]|uniref:Aspartate racemase n=1 Tax=Mobiluncus mulieris TaxID=2052 RepID=A0A8G2HSY0_9ACTO|nr:amino acid racemase [Mobiluncus mulieris]MBB5845691.1 aspartate racemase [Mobiluncus mulieris]STO15645.1 Aspartate racemase [Mobiluncus mulieris]